MIMIRQTDQAVLTAYIGIRPNRSSKDRQIIPVLDQLPSYGVLRNRPAFQLIINDLVFLLLKQIKFFPKPQNLE